MLHPNTGVEFGKEVDEVRKEEAALRSSLSLAEAVVEAVKECAKGAREDWERVMAALRAYDAGKEGG